MYKHKVIADDDEFYKIWNDESLDVRPPLHIGEEKSKTLMVYRDRAGFERSHSTASIFLSSRTTALARMKLMETIETIQDHWSKEEAQLLYCDTDSIIIRHKKELLNAIKAKLKVDDFLGCLKIEKEEYDILEYASGGNRTDFYKKFDFRLQAICFETAQERRKP